MLENEIYRDLSAETDGDPRRAVWRMAAELAVEFAPLDDDGVEVVAVEFSEGEQGELCVDVEIEIEAWCFLSALNDKFEAVLGYKIAQLADVDMHQVEVMVEYINLPTEYDADGMPTGRFGCSCC